MKKPDFPYYLTSFLGKYLPGQKNVSRNTIESYAVTFKLFFFFCESEKNLKTEKKIGRASCRERVSSPV